MAPTEGLSRLSSWPCYSVVASIIDGGFGCVVPSRVSEGERGKLLSTVSCTIAGMGSYSCNSSDSNKERKTTDRPTDRHTDRQGEKKRRLRVSFDCGHILLPLLFSPPSLLLLLLLFPCTSHLFPKFSPSVLDRGIFLPKSSFLPLKEEEETVG